MQKEKYYLYVDECGDQNLANFDTNFPIFTLCGIIVSEQMNDILNRQIIELKKKYWGDKKIILHSRDIRKCQNGFEILFNLDIKQRFYDDVNKILGQKGVYIIVCCTILKEPYIRMYGKMNDVYAQSMSFLIERSVFYFDTLKKDLSINVIVEMRGKKEDSNLRKHFMNILDKGTYWVTPDRMRNYINSFELKPKKADITGLQIADLIAYPITRHILDPEAVNFPYDVICPNIYEENGKLLGVKIMP